jgi:probable rRNA maturation factor
MINLIISDQFQNMVSESQLTNAAEIVLNQEEVGPDAELSIVIDDDDRLRDLNNQFLGIDSPTDVLSFPADEHDPDSGLHYIGDIIVSYPRASEQAAVANELVSEELQLLVIHGTLHLLGYDHSDPTEKAAMWNAQQLALNAIGCKIQNLPE